MTIQIRKINNNMLLNSLLSPQIEDPQTNCVILFSPPKARAPPRHSKRKEEACTRGHRERRTAGEGNGGA